MIAKAKLCLKKIRLDKQLKIHQIAVQEYNAKVLPEALLIAGDYNINSFNYFHFSPEHVCGFSGIFSSIFSFSSFTYHI